MDRSYFFHDTVLGLSYCFLEDMELGDAGDGVVRVVSGVWIPLYITPGTVRWGEEWQRGDAGLYYEQRFSADFPADIQDDMALLDRLSRKPMYVCFHFGRGRKVVGSKDQPVRLQVGTSTTGGSGVGFSFTRKSVCLAPWLSD